MKRYVWLILILFSVLLPPGVLEAVSQDRVYPKIYYTTNLVRNPQNYLGVIFAPLGWSKDGKFAYIIGREPGGAEYEEIGGHFRWVIQDLDNDKILWESPRGLEPGLPKNLTDELKVFKWVYNNLSVKYRPYLQKYKINIQFNLQLLKFPVYYNKRNYDASITGMTRMTKPLFGFLSGIVDKYRVVVTSDGKVKTVLQYSYPKQRLALIDAQVGGYFKSPYEPRIAIAIANVEHGWEGPPHTVDLALAGCRLDKGF